MDLGLQDRSGLGQLGVRRVARTELQGLGEPGVKRVEEVMTILSGREGHVLAPKKLVTWWSDGAMLLSVIACRDQW